MINFQDELRIFPTALCLDEGVLSEKDLFRPFALTDVLTDYAGAKQQPFVHFWQFNHTMILGMKDTRVPFLENGLEVLRQANYRPIIRNSGGLGVIADEGVLNVSLILPNIEKKISIDEAYTWMWQWIQEAFETAEAPIKAYEISESYCPGTFDLSIHGKKFAGTAQRRIKDGIAIMIYLSVHGDQNARGQIVKKFYQEALQNDFGQNGYPPVNPAVMANLSDLLNTPLTIKQAKQKLLDVLKSYTALDTEQAADLLLTETLKNEMDKQTKKMIERNQRLKE